MQRLTWRRLAWPALLIALTLALYAPALGYGLIWDDPRWYGQAAGRSLEQLFFGLKTYQFYRPFSLLLNQQFIAADGRVLAGAAHAAQLAAHLAAVLLLAPALRALGLKRWHADLSALAFALYPMAFQAVAWQAPQGPWILSLSLAAVAAAGRFARGRTAWGLVSAVAFASALLFQESALPLAAFVVYAVWRKDGGETREKGKRLSSLFARPSSRTLLFSAGIAGIAVLYLAIWLNVPRDANVTGEGRDPRVLAYLLQAAAWPVARALAGPLAAWTPQMLVLVFGGVVLGLGGALAARGEAVAAALALAWIGFGLLPPWVGLSWEYVNYGERLTYVMAPGVAVLWAGLAAWILPLTRARGSVGVALSSRILAPLLAALGMAAYASLGLVQLRDFRAVYATGTTQLRSAIDVLAAAPDSRFLFVNFPDRYELRAPYYPLGFWGIVLAPVIQDLRDFAIADAGQAGQDVSASAFVTGALEREAWPYRVDMRGVNAGPDGLVEQALPLDGVYLSDYLAHGGLRLSNVGDVAPDTGGTPLATFGDLVALRSATRGPNGALELRWAALRQPSTDDALFIHVWQGDTFVTDVGGDALGGLIPLWAWRPGDLIIDRRTLPLAALPPGDLTLRVGVFNRATGERYPLVGAAGVDNAYALP